ncbi:MAG: T9SS type A sorting domain-containing protein [Bacteroidota bacterium]
MKNSIILPILALCFLTLSVKAQTALLSISSTSINGSTVTFDLNIEGSGANVYLGNSDFVLSFNTGAFNNPAFSITLPGNFRTESDSDSDAAVTQDNYLFSTATSINSDELVINLSGPNPASMLAFDRRVAKFPNGEAKKLGTFQITGYQGGDLDLSWEEASTIVSSITLPDFNEVQIPITTSLVLPVELGVFEAIPGKDNTVDLIWETVSEKNNDGFEIQYSRDGQTWSKLSFVSGQGTTNDFQSYTYTHREANIGTNYYRLKQIDFDRNFEYSKVKVVKLDGTGSTIKVYPNPTVDIVNIEMDELDNAQNILIYDQQGKMVLNQVIGAGTTMVNLQVGHFAAGIYRIHISSNNNTYQTQNLIIKDF